VAALLQQAMVSQFARKRFVADEPVSTQARSATAISPTCP